MKYFPLFLFAFVTHAAFGFADLKEELYAQASKGHVALSYSGARIKMFNVIDLKTDARGSFVTDVYCNERYDMYKVGEAAGSRLPDPIRMNTEHTWPQSKFNSNANTQKTDLHHLYPTLSKINSERGNLPFADVKAGKGLSCDLSELGKPDNGSSSGKYFEPPVEHKGNLARSLLYFSIRYKMPVDPVQEYYMRQWHILDPVDANEKQRHEKIYSIQKNRNPFIDEPALVNQVLDF